MIELTDEQASVLKQGYPVRVSVPGLGGDVVIVLAAQEESTESVLQEPLDEIREQAAWSQLGRRAPVLGGQGPSLVRASPLPPPPRQPENRCGGTVPAGGGMGEPNRYGFFS